jgi:hypothetical protein
VEVHEVVDDAALEVVLDAVDDDLLADVHDLEEGVLALVAVLIEALVDLLIVADAVAEVEGGGVRVLAGVVGAGSLHVADVGHDETLVVTTALDEDDLDALAGASVKNPLAAVFCGVCGIEDSYCALGLPEPLQHVVDSGLCGGAAFSLTLLVGVVEEVRGGLGL